MAVHLVGLGTTMGAFFFLGGVNPRHPQRWPVTFALVTLGAVGIYLNVFV